MRRTPDHRQNTTAGASSAGRPLVRHAAARRLLAATAGAALAVGLSGCAGGTPPAAGTGEAEPATSAASNAGAGNGPSTSETAVAEPLADTSEAPSTTAAEAVVTETVKKTVIEVLGRLAAGSPKPATAEVAEALTEAGIEPAVLEVSQSRTPTGLEADAVEAAVLQGKDCVIGQVRDGAVTVTILPVLASGKCFVGS